MKKLKNYSCKEVTSLKVSNEFRVKLKERKNIESGEKISIVSDTMFKAMFMSERRIKYAAKLVSYFFDYTYEELLEKLHFYKNELSKEKEYSKGERCDFVAELDGGFINIEVNSNDTVYTMERNVEYVFRIYASSNNIGKGYNYKQVVQFNLNNFSYVGKDEIIDIYSLKNDKNEVLTDKIIIVQIYLPNIYKKCYNQGIESLTEGERYLLVLAEQNISKAKEYAMSDEVMKDYLDESNDIITDNGFGESYDHEWALKDQGRREGIEEGIKRGIEKGKKDGIKEGIERGKKEGVIQVALSMKNAFVDIETISRCIELSMEEISKL